MFGFPYTDRKVNVPSSRISFYSLVQDNVTESASLLILTMITTVLINLPTPMSAAQAVGNIVLLLHVIVLTRVQEPAS